MKLRKLLMISILSATLSGCVSEKRDYASFDDYPVRSGNLLEMIYTPISTKFMLWAPTADRVRLMIYEKGEGGEPEKLISMTYKSEGTWEAVIREDLNGKFYTFSVKVGEEWLDETPGINARAVGVNGERGAIINMYATNPLDWDKDKRPNMKSEADMVIYEMHHRDFSIHESSGIEQKGKYLALTQKYSTIPESYISTGIDHLVELGITHVHLLPSFDYASINEKALHENNYNWGYDPVNYNVPEGSYATDPYDPATRIREFKKMVQTLHSVGIRVVLDVVYNHTFNASNSAFERTVPGYFYRHNVDGSLADGSACGNETASERAMMRKFMIESVLYWIDEYHIDGFRFDLMGIHDIETMNEIRKAIDQVDPTICVYGEGWAAKAPQYPAKSLAMKANIGRMPGIAAFSDELRDGLRGPFNDNEKGAFLAGIPGGEESIKFGIVGGVYHPQVNYSEVNYSDAAWAKQPTQMISYVSCHDDMCLVDRLQASIPGMSTEQLIKLNKLAQTAVFTSQGIPFLFAGEEVMRNKKGVHNSYKSSDMINAIDWRGKIVFKDIFEYYKGLIRLRKNHPAFRMGDAGMIRKHLEFIPVEKDNLIAFRLRDHVNGDPWREIIVALNGNSCLVELAVSEGEYTVVCYNGYIDENGLEVVEGPSVLIPAHSALIMYKN